MRTLWKVRGRRTGWGPCALRNGCGEVFQSPFVSRESQSWNKDAGTSETPLGADKNKTEQNKTKPPQKMFTQSLLSSSQTTQEKLRHSTNYSSEPGGELGQLHYYSVKNTVKQRKLSDRKRSLINSTRCQTPWSDVLRFLVKISLICFELKTLNFIGRK